MAGGLCVILLQIQECLQVSPQLTDFQVISEGWKLEVLWGKVSCSAYSFMITHKFQMWMNSWLALIHTPLWGLNSPQAFANVTAASEAGFCSAWEFTVSATWFTYLHISFHSFANAVAKRKSTLNTKDSIAGCFYFCITAVITACWFTRLTVSWIGCSSARFVSILSWSWSCYLKTVLFKCTMSSIS